MKKIVATLLAAFLIAAPVHAADHSLTHSKSADDPINILDIDGGATKGGTCTVGEVVECVGANGQLGYGTDDTSAPTVDDANNSSNTVVLDIEKTTSGTPQAGIGGSLGIKVEDAGGSQRQARIEVNLTTVTDGSEDADMEFYVMDGGSETSILRLVGASRRVGINVEPDGTLHALTNSAGSVTAAANFDDLVVEQNAAGGITVLTPDANNASIGFGSPSDSLGAAIYWNHDADLLTVGTQKSSADLALATGADSEALRILQSGVIGIGDTTPDAVLDIATAIDNQYVVRVESQDTDSGESFGVRITAGTNSSDAALLVKDQSGVTDFFRVKGDGDIGINTDSPEARLHIIQATAANTDIGVLSEDGRNSFMTEHTNADYTSAWGHYSGNGAPFFALHAIHSATANTLKNSNAGFQGFGMVHGNGSDNVVFMFNDSTVADADFSATTTALLLEADGDVQVGKFATANSATVCWDNSGISYLTSCTSLSKFKEDVEDLPLGLDTLMELRPVEYTWTEDQGGQRDLGFIAEEVESINPILATYANGELGGVKYRHMTALLVKAIQELNQTIEDLEARIDVLENS